MIIINGKENKPQPMAAIKSALLRHPKADRRGLKSPLNNVYAAARKIRLGVERFNIRKKIRQIKCCLKICSPCKRIILSFFF